MATHGPPTPTAPSAVHVRVGLYLGTKIVSRGSSGNMNGSPGKKPMNALHCSLPSTAAYSSSRSRKPL